MPSSAELLNQILTRSGLDRRDGHPLYRYRVTVDELEALRESLRASIERYSDLMTQEDYAAFCLFASEWFRRACETMSGFRQNHLMRRSIGISIMSLRPCKLTSFDG